MAPKLQPNGGSKKTNRALLKTCLLALLLTLMNPPPGAGANLTVRLFDYADIGPQVRQAMVQEAKSILMEAGVASEWVVCRAPRTSISPDVCSQPLSPNEFVLRLVPGRSASWTALGLSLITVEGGTMANLYPEPARVLASQSRWTLPALLAHAAAHELGHLVLLEPDHADAGIMRAKWTPEELRAMGREDLLFSPDDAERLVKELQRRGAE